MTNNSLLQLNSYDTSDSFGHLGPQLSLLLIQNETGSSIAIHAFQTLLNDLFEGLIQCCYCIHLYCCLYELLDSQHGLEELIMLSKESLELLVDEQDFLNSALLNDLEKLLLVLN